MHNIEAALKAEKSSFVRRKDKASRFMAKVGVAAVCAIPPADLALSDAVGIKVYQTVNEQVELKPKAAERSLEVGINSGIIIAEIIAGGMLISRNKRLRSISGDFDEYLEKKQEAMSPKRRAVSKVVNAPLVGLQKTGQKIEKFGENISKKRGKTAQTAGKLAMDAGMINALGTNTVALQETLAGNPPTVGRMAKLGALFTATWLGPVEAIRTAYDNVPAVRPPLDALGYVFDQATSVDAAHPWRSPVASSVLGAVGCALAVSGWNIGKYHEEKEAQELYRIHVDPADIPEQPN